MDVMDRLYERHAQEDRLREAGFDVDGGGIGFSHGDSDWDIFVYLPGDDRAVILSSIEEVDRFIASSGWTGGQRPSGL